MTRFFAILLTFFFATSAYADDPFTVGGVQVDATAATAIEAQTLAMRDGQLAAAEILFDRLTLENERLANPLPELTPELVARMIRAMVPGKEKRSANRYLGEVTVAFNPSQVQQFLRDNQLTLVSSQARERLVFLIDQAPTLRGTSEVANIFSDPRLSYALTPLRAARAEDTFGITSATSADHLKAIASGYGLNQVLIVEPSGQVTDVALDTGERQTFFISGSPTTPDFADRIVERLEAEWKQASAVVATEVVSTPVSVLYNSHQSWIALQQAINTSAQIRGARLDALSKDGALMTITYGGDISRLANELRFKGVSVEQDPELGLVFTALR